MRPFFITRQPIFPECPGGASAWGSVVDLDSTQGFFFREYGNEI